MRGLFRRDEKKNFLMRDFFSSVEELLRLCRRKEKTSMKDLFSSVEDFVEEKKENWWMSDLLIFL
jgi:hypothetical protein